MTGVFDDIIVKVSKQAVTSEEVLLGIKKFGINLVINSICENEHIRSTLNIIN